MNITVYTLPTCKWCEKVKSFLKDHHVDFEEKHVAHDPYMLRQVYEQTKQTGVPVTHIGDEWVVGYDEARLTQLLNL